MCQREPNEIVLKFHLVAGLRYWVEGKRMVRSVGRERDGSKTGNEQNERARILKLVALGQNEGKSSVRL